MFEKKQFLVELDCGDVLIDGQYVAQLCWDEDSIGAAIASWLKGEGDTGKSVPACCICGRPYTGEGNDPWPVRESGRCCERCNRNRVLPARLRFLNEEAGNA